MPTRDERQFEFPFLKESQEESQKYEAKFKVRTIDCSQDRHHYLPNGICMFCRKQIYHGTQEGFENV